MQSWLKAPLVDPAAIRQRLDIVAALVGDQGLREGVRDALRGERLRLGVVGGVVCCWWWCRVDGWKWRGGRVIIWLLVENDSWLGS